MLSYTGYPFYLLSRARCVMDILFGWLYPSMRPEQRDLSQSTVIVTGANVGIGLEIARKLAEMNATVVLACRNKDKAKAARMDILGNQKIDPAKVEVLILDCADLKSVERLAENWGSRKLDILVNNAGMSNNSYTKNIQGFEMTYVTNILSHYLLTSLLLPSIQKYGRIVNVSSFAQYGVENQFDARDLDHSKALGDLQEGTPFNAATSTNVYSRTKLMQVFFTREMQQRLDKSDIFKELAISVHACNPGVVKSSIWERPTSMKLWWKKYLLAVVNVLGISTEQGACTAVHLAVSSTALENKGLYWACMGVRGSSRLVEDKEARRKIWEQWTEESGLGVRALL